MNDEESGYMECPDCHGDGYHESFTDEWSMTRGHYTNDYAEECETCCGDGEIEVED